MRTLSKDEIRKFVLDHPHYFEIQPHETKYRLGSDKYDSVKKVQNKFINDIYYPLTKQELNFLKPFVLKANDNLKRILKPFGLDKKPIETIIIKTIDGKDWQMPYTKANVIVLPQRVIQGGQHLARTITHEKLHIYQRMFPEIFKKYYKEQMNFDDLKLNSEQVKQMKEMGIDKVMIQNPDTIDTGLMIYQQELLPLSVLMPLSEKPINIVLKLTPEKVILENNNQPHEWLRQSAS